MPSLEDRRRWERLAAKKGYPAMTKFVYDHVELALRNEGAITGAVKQTLLKNIRELEAEVGELKKGVFHRSLTGGMLPFNFSAQPTQPGDITAPGLSPGPP